MTALMIVTIVLTAAGLIMMLASLIGLIRMPDFFTRLHAQGIGDTLGAFLVLAGMAVSAGTGLLSLKLLLIFVIIVLTNPIGTNLMMIAAVNREDYQGYRSRLEAAAAEKSDRAAGHPIPEMSEQPVMPHKEEAKKEPGKPEKSGRKRRRKPSMNMNRAELVKEAESRGISVPDRATKREILDLIYADKKK